VYCTVDYTGNRTYNTQPQPQHRKAFPHTFMCNTIDRHVAPTTCSRPGCAQACLLRLCPVYMRAASVTCDYPLQLHDELRERQVIVLAGERSERGDFRIDWAAEGKRPAWGAAPDVADGFCTSRRPGQRHSARSHSINRPGHQSGRNRISGSDFHHICLVAK
jgi:hypothetical protein